MIDIMNTNDMKSNEKYSSNSLLVSRESDISAVPSNSFEV